MPTGAPIGFAPLTLPVGGERTRNFVGQHFWGRDYFVSTVGRDEATVREYIRHQELEDQRPDQLKLWRCSATFRCPENGGAGLTAPFSRFERLTNSSAPALPGDDYSRT
jgi:hypothetical protein